MSMLEDRLHRLIVSLLTSSLMLNSIALAESEQTAPLPYWQSQPFAEMRPKLRRRPTSHFGHIGPIDDVQAAETQSTHHRSDHTWRLGIAFGIPDAFTLDLSRRLSDRWLAKVFFAPPIAFKIRVEMSQHRISSSRGVEIEHPDLQIPFKALYGPQVGSEIWWFPFNENFFLQFGLSYREFALKGKARSPLIVRPEGSQESITTRTEFGLNAQSLTSSMMLRAGLGWHFNLADNQYWFVHAAGIAQPMSPKTKVKVTADIHSPGVDNDEISGALAELKSIKEAELDEKARKEMKPAERTTLPIISMGIGWRF